VTLVLLPGLNGTRDLFVGLLSAMNERFKVVCIDYPEDEELGYRELEVFVRKSLPIDGPFVLVGESFSGPIAISIAAEEPSGLIGLVLCCSFVRNPRPILASLFWLPSLIPLNLVPQGVIGRVALGRAFSSSVSREIAAAVRGISPNVLRARLREISLVDVSSRFARVSVPVLSLVGKHDLMVPREASSLLTQTNSNTEVIELEAPHFLFQSAPKEAALAIEKFVRRIA
jgi:pimeloyl-ACP methyl ester carboxylesterase